jgi:hypothetical protein
MDALDISTASGGSARRNGTKISYTAPPGAFTGADSFSYVLVDNNDDVSKPATVHANVVRNQTPQVKDGYVSVPQNRKAVGSIAKLGWDPEKDAITFELRSTPAGQLTLKPDGTFLYQAPAGVQVDAFSFVANDGNSDSNEGHLSIQVTQAQATAASSTTTTAPAAAGPTTTTTASSTTSTTRRSTTSTTGRSTATTSSTATTATTGKSPNSSTTAKPTGASSSKPKKAPGSNNHGKTPPSGTSPTTTTTTKAILVPMLPLAAVPAVARRRRRRRQHR